MAELTSIDGIIGALYRSICFGPGDKPDYDLLRTLFVPDGHLAVPTDDSPVGVTVLDVEGFIEFSVAAIETADFAERGFHEKEVARRIDATADLAQVFSTYEARFMPDDPEPMARGINSIQLVRSAGRWWVVSMIWEDEGPLTPIPKAYLPPAV